MRTMEKAMCLCPSHLQTPTDELRSPLQPSPSRLPSRVRLVPAPPQSFFSAEAHPPEKPPQSRFAKALAGEAHKEAAPICDGGCRPFPYVLFKEPLCGLVSFGRSSTTLPGGKGLSLAG